ncbi:MAG: CHAT domain-containing protein [Bacteroidia bacterium]|nr:CHAT domain-containing protein [Bacteroidia bacterium]
MPLAPLLKVFYLLGILFFLTHIAQAQDVNSLEMGQYYRDMGWDKLVLDQLDSAMYFNKQALASGPVERYWAELMEAERQYFEAHVSLFKKDYPNAIAHAERAGSLASNLNQWGDTLAVYVNMMEGFIYTRWQKLDKARVKLDKASDRIKEMNIAESELAGIFYTNEGVFYMTQGKLQEAEDLFYKAIDIFKKCSPPKNLELSKAYMDIGGLQLKRQELHEGVENLKLALQYHEKLPSPSKFHQAKTCYNLAAGMIMLKDFEMASRYAYAAKDLYHEINNPSESQVYVLISVIYSENGQWDKAIEYTQYYYRNAVGIHGPNSRYAAGALGNISQFYQQKGDIENAILYNEKAWNAINNMENPPVMESFTMCRQDATIAAEQRDFEKLEQALDKALEYGKYLSPRPEMLLAQSYVTLSYIFYEQGDYDRALYFGRLFQKLRGDDGQNSTGFYIVSALMGQNKLGEADENLQKAYDVLNVDIDLETPKIKHRTGRLKPTKMLVQNLSLTGRYYMSKAANSQSKEDWLKSYNAYQLTANYLDSLRYQNKSFDSQTELLKEKHRVFEQGLVALYELYKADGSEEWVKKAFDFAEKSKAILLSESLKAQQALTFSGIPEAVQQEEQSLRREIYYLQKQVSIAKEMGRPALLAKVEGWQQKILELNEKYEKLAMRLTREYPSYMEIRYQPTLANSEKIQADLRKDEALVEFFVGDSTAFAIVLKKGATDFIKIEAPKKWSHKVKELREELLASFKNEGEGLNYPKLANDLYQYIWEPLEALELPQKITLVPDGALGYLSFDVLLSEMPEQAKAYKNFSYLIKKYQFRYTYSAKLLNTKGNKGFALPAGKKFIAFAPAYPTGDKNLATLRSDLADLPYAYEEAQKARNIMGGKLLSGEEASEGNFKQLADAYKIIHIAAHARVDDQNPLYSSIYFSPEVEGDEDQSLEVFELFNMNLSAELMVLSACETGVGEMKRGEGIISLAWGASYAGAKSVLTSLWQVNDLATSRIIEDFYKELENGKDKDEALREAKLNYLSQGDHLTAHPFYWGGFILIGDYSPLRKFQLLIALGIFLLAAMGVGLGIYMSRRGGKLQP